MPSRLLMLAAASSLAALVSAPGEASAFGLNAEDHVEDVQITNATDNALSGTSATNACYQFQLNGRRDVFRWVTYLKECGALTDAQVDTYIPNYAGLRTLIDSKVKMVQTAQGLDAAVASALNDPSLANQVWKYPVYVDGTWAATKPAISAAMSSSSVVWTPPVHLSISTKSSRNGRILKVDTGDSCPLLPAASPAGPKTAILGATCTVAAPATPMLRPGTNASSPWEERCRIDDLIGAKTLVDARNNYALGCTHIAKEDYDDMYIDPELALARDKPHYVSYAYDHSGTPDCTNSQVQSWSTCFPIWKPEGDEAGRNRTQSFGADGKYNMCTLPPTVMTLTSCIMGCFAPDQRILFSTGYQAIETAIADGKLDIVTLAPDATFDDLRLTKNQVAKYVGDGMAQEQDVVTLVTETGAKLRVTPSHPLLAEDGTIRQAKAFQVGDRLIRVDGSFDAVKAVSKERETLKVYNVRPTSTDDTSNVIVAEGYLSASERYQSDDDRYLNRQILRKSIPTDVAAGN